MSAICPDGHSSATTDYCDQCGTRIEGTAEVAAVRAEAPTTEHCSGCGTPRIGRDRYCEGCGRPFGGIADPPEAWEAIITAERARFQRSATTGIEFPADCAPQRLSLVAPELCIGRDAELGGAGGDPAVSSRHAQLVRGPDGSYAVVDQGSTNGTTVNEDPNPIPAGVPVRLADGDRVHVGAWTTITVRTQKSRG